MSDSEREELVRKIVWALPRDVVYWCAIRVGAEATVGRYCNQVPAELLFMEALKRWEEK